MRALKFLTWIPSGSLIQALDPDLNNEEFNRLWRMRHHGFLIGWLLPIWVLIGRLLRFEPLIDWYIQRCERRAGKKSKPADASEVSTIPMTRRMTASPTSRGTHRKAA